MKNNIKKRDSFMCISNYIMEDDWIAYKKGTTYVSEKDCCITDEWGDDSHYMESEEDFKEYFVKILANKAKIKGSD